MSKDWRVVEDAEELETALDEVSRKRSAHEEISPYERRRLGGLVTRQRHGQTHYRDMGRKSQAKRRRAS